MHNRGGLFTLFSMVLGGVAAATPHMIAASVMALARLMYEFARPLEFAMGDLLPAVLSLLRTKSREVVKAVLGFVKVGCQRLDEPGVWVREWRQGVGLDWANSKGADRECGCSCMCASLQHLGQLVQSLLCIKTRTVVKAVLDSQKVALRLALRSVCCSSVESAGRVVSLHKGRRK